MLLDRAAPLGRSTPYIENYDSSLLFPVSRSLARINLPKTLPFRKGEDIWNGFELSWLNSNGKPVVALAEFRFPWDSPNIVESKSFKLYLNSFNQSQFPSIDAVKTAMESDLSAVVESSVFVHIIPLAEGKKIEATSFTGKCLDDLDVVIDTYQVDASFLKAGTNTVEETLYSDLLKSNCLATGQPDWGSVSIHYLGAQIDHEGLLKYIISYRRHSGFAEHCVEQMYCDIWQHCNPEKLTVYARYTKRGGLDINPFRSNFEQPPADKRLIRQ